MNLKPWMFLGLGSLLAAVFANFPIQEDVRNIGLPLSWWAFLAMIAWFNSMLHMVKENICEKPVSLWVSVSGIAGFILLLEWSSAEACKQGVPFEGSHANQFFAGVAQLLMLCHIVLMLAWFAFNIGALLRLQKTGQK